MYRKILITAFAGCLACGTALAGSTGQPLPREPGYRHYLAELAAFDQKFTRPTPTAKAASTATKQKPSRR